MGIGRARKNDFDDREEVEQLVKMPFVKCPDCSTVFHLLVQKNIEEWNKKHLTSEDGHRYIQCFTCWKKLDESGINKQEATLEERERYEQE